MLWTGHRSIWVTPFFNPSAPFFWHWMMIVRVLSEIYTQFPQSELLSPSLCLVHVALLKTEVHARVLCLCDREFRGHDLTFILHTHWNNWKKLKIDHSALYITKAGYCMYLAENYLLRNCWVSGIYETKVCVWRVCGWGALKGWIWLGSMPITGKQGIGLLFN